jgi:hypothetical protein
LLTDQNWSGLLCEADPIRSQQSAALYSHRPDIKIISALVDVQGDNSLLSILSREQVVKDFDFLSIDVDGNDYHLWESLENSYFPRVVCIEFNPTIPNHIVFIQENVMSTQQGSSLLALVELGNRLGYQLICTTTFNAFFVRKDLMNLLPQPSGTETLGVGTREGAVDYSLSALHDSTMITDLFQTYDGELKLCGPKKLIWHKVAINIQSIQPLKKKKLRQFPFAPRTSSQAEAGAAAAGAGVASSVTSSTPRNDDQNPNLLRLEESLEVLIDKYQVISTQCEVKGIVFRENFLGWWTHEFVQSFLEKCSQLIEVAQEIIGGVSFENSSSPFYEIAIDALLWCLLILSHTSHLLRASWSSATSPVTSSLSLPDEISAFLFFSLQSIHSISSLYQSIGDSYSASNGGGNQNLNLASKYFHHSLSFYCLFHCCAFAPFSSSSSSSPSSPSLQQLSEEVSSSIAKISAQMNSKIKINKKNKQLFNFSHINDTEDSSSHSGGGGSALDSRKLWQMIFEKSYWIWLQHTAAPTKTAHPELGLEFYSLVTNNLGEQLVTRVQDANQMMSFSSSSVTAPRLQLQLQSHDTAKMGEVREDEEEGQAKEDTAELLDIISRACGRLNLRNKYREYHHQTQEVRRLEQQLAQYQRMVAVLVGVTCVSVGFSILFGCRWKPSFSLLR